jgi:hypothetical protein
VRRALIALALVAAVGGRAFGAAKSVTLLGVSGAGGDRFADLIEQDLGDLYELIPGEVYKAGAARLGKQGASPEEVQAVATRLRIDAVIGGAIVGDGASRHLLIAVRDGATGRVIARGRYDLSGRTLPMIRERVVADLVRALERAGHHAPNAPHAPNARAPSDESPDEITDEPPTTTGEPVAREPDPDPTVSVTRKAPPPATNNQGIQAGVGVSIMTRSLSFDAASAPSYTGGTVAGIRADGAVFPFALSAELAQAHPVIASFGFVGSYEHVFNFTSSTLGAQSAGHASRWMILFVGRIPLGHNAIGGTLTIETGFQQLSWGHQSQLDIGVPDVKYDLIDAGLSWERAIFPRWALLSLRFAYLAPVSAGDIESETQYGRSSGWGIEADGGLTSWPTRWLWIRVDARYSRVGLDFNGSGTRFAHSSADQWISGALEVGFAL